MAAITAPGICNVNPIEKKRSELRTVRELVGRFPGHKLTEENRCGLWPCCWDSAGRFYEAMEGWRLAGWAYPPFPGRASTALVFQLVRKTSKLDCREPGYYWCHGRTDEREWKAFKQHEEEIKKVKGRKKV